MSFMHACECLADAIGKELTMNENDTRYDALIPAEIEIVLFPPHYTLSPDADVRVEKEMVWLNEKQMSRFFPNSVF